MDADERLLAYVTRSLLPTWRVHGVDPETGGFHERLGQDLRPVPLTYRRLLTQCRQVFSFAEGAALADLPWAKDIATRGFRYLREHYEDRRNGGWTFALGEGGPLPSRSRQLYAHAFVLLACWAQVRATGDDQAAAVARRTAEFIGNHFRTPTRGLHTVLDEDLRDLGHIRQQNPHMHLFESCLLLLEETGERPYGEMAASLADLLLDIFLDDNTGTLIEHFDADWSPHPELGRVREPGHHFEWAWLLHRWRGVARRYGLDARGDEVDRAADRMLSWALMHGVDRQHGGLFDEVGPEGQLLKETKRIWPVCEALKALRLASAVTERGGLVLEQEADALVGLLFDRYFAPHNGTWVEVLDRDLSPRTDYLPSTTPYHIVMAARELARP
jgi:mannose-6-phosphate isomerase